MNPTIDKVNASIAKLNASGAKLSPLKPIAVDTLGTPPKPAKIGPTVPQSATAGAAGYIQSTQDTFTQGLTDQAAQAEAAKNSSLDALIKTISSGEGEVALTDKAYSGAVDPLAAELKNINSQITAEQVAARHQVEALQKNAKGLSTEALQSRVNDIERQSLSKQADLAVIQMAKQGQFDSAKAIADRAVAVKLEQQQSKVDILRLAYEDNKDLFTATEQREFEVKQADRERELNFERDKEMARFDQLIRQSDPLYQAQVANTIANTANTYSTIAERNTPDGGTYSGEFAGTIDLATNLYAGRSVAAQKGFKSAIQGAVGSQDYQTAYSLIAQATANGLQGEQRNKFESAAIDQQLLKTLRDRILAYQQAGGDMNLLKSAANDSGKRLGVLTVDKPYNALATEIDTAFQVYRQNMTGAAFGAQESAAYQKVRPSTSGSFDVNLSTIEGALNYSNNYVESTIKSKIGEGGIYIKQYAEGAVPATGEAADNDPLGIR